MKRTFLCAVLLLVVGIGPVFSQDIIQSNIKEVTLFTNQAQVVREASVDVGKGVVQLLLGLEAFTIDKDSVSAKVFGKGEMYSVQYKEIFLKEAPQKVILDLEKELQELKDAKRILTDEKRTLDKEVLFIDNVVTFSSAQVSEEMQTHFPDVKDFKDTLQFVDESSQGIAKRKLSIDQELRELKKEIKVLERKLTSVRSGRQKKKGVIEVMFNSAKEQTVTLSARYLVYNASWNPLYKVNVGFDLKEVDLVMFSKMRQKTGEDWNDITLAVSNIVPLRGARLPSLGSWFLDIARYEKGERFGQERKADFLALRKSKLASAPLEEAEYGVGDEPVTAQGADFSYAEKRELPLSFEYELPQRLTIESEEKETLLPLFSKTIKGEFHHFVVPKVSPLVFLVCRVQSDKELLSGALNVYFGGRFIGKTFLSEKKPGEDFSISLGADREIKVTREKIEDSVKETFFGKIERKTIIRKLVFKITLENLKDDPVMVHLLDSIPVARTDKIEVKEVKFSPKPTTADYLDKKGVMLWKVKLAPRAKKEINIECTIAYSKELPIVGL